MPTVRYVKTFFFIFISNLWRLYETDKIFLVRSKGSSAQKPSSSGVG